MNLYGDCIQFIPDRARSHEADNCTNDHIKAKISSAEQMKVHTMRVIGARDLEERVRAFWGSCDFGSCPVFPRRTASCRSRKTHPNAISVRERGKGNLGAKPRDEVIADILSRIRTRAA